MLYPLRWWLGDQFYLIRLFNYGLPWLLIGLVLGLVVTAVRSRQQIWWQMMTVSTVFISLPLLPIFLPGWGNQPAGPAALKVMSYSLCKANWETQAIVQVITRVQPDLLLLQEVRPDMARKLAKHLADLYAPYKLHLAYEAHLQQAVISRYPLRRVGASRTEGRVQKIMVDTLHGVIEVWNVHASQPFYWQQHYQELTALAEAIGEVEGPFVVGGDFNAVDQSEMYRLIAARLHNAHRQVGSGFGFTFPAPQPDIYCHSNFHYSFIPPLIRIDHIFYSRHFLAHQAETLPQSGGSDHLPVWVSLSLKP